MTSNNTTKNAPRAHPRPRASFSRMSTWTTAAMLAPVVLLGLVSLPQILFPSASDQWNIGQLIPSAMKPNKIPSVMNATHGPINLAQRYAEGCPDHRYIIRFLSEDPLMMYVQNLLSKEEADHFLDLAEPFYKPSAVVGTKGKTYDPEFRKSVSARVPEDAVIKCIRKRVADFQGFISVDRVEDIHVVKYGKDDHIRFHFDGHEGLLNPRLSTFFVYVACDDKLNGGTCEGGETGFPNWPGSFAREWCDLGLVDCAQSEKGGIYFRPIVGNAIFWHNIYPNGTEVEGTYHGGMPVTKGRKAGLNIWSRKYGISKEILRVNDRNQLSEKDRAKCDAASKDGPCYVEVV